MSKRAGNVITLRDLIDEVGADATRFTYLLQSIDSPQTVDLDLVTSAVQGEPGLLRADGLRPAALDRPRRRRARRDPRCRSPTSTCRCSTHERELDVLRPLSELPDVVELAARERAPHKVTTWVRELAGAVHGFYHDCSSSVTTLPESVSQARLWLVDAAGIGLASASTCSGVDAPEQM